MTKRATEIEAVHHDVAQDAAAGEVFAAEIRPHRSLGPRGVAIVLGAFGALTLVVSVPFFILGAWPVVGFLGLDVVLLWLAFRLSFAQARACEQVALSYLELMVRKVSARGSAREWRFNPAWVRIETDTDADFGMTRLAVCARDARLDVCSALSPQERAEFAKALTQALATARSGPRHNAG